MRLCEQPAVGAAPAAGERPCLESGERRQRALAADFVAHHHIAQLLQELFLVAHALRERGPRGRQRSGGGGGGTSIALSLSFTNRFSSVMSCRAASYCAFMARSFTCARRCLSCTSMVCQGGAGNPRTRLERLDELRLVLALLHGGGHARHRLTDGGG